MSARLTLARFLPYRANRLAQGISDSLSRIYMERFGISVPEWRVLVTLAEYPELRASQITGLTAMDKVRVSRAVAGLARRDLLQRRPCEEDSRAAWLSLTTGGQSLYRRIEPEVLAWEADFLEPLSKGQRAQLFELLDTLDQRLQTLEAQTAD